MSTLLQRFWEKVDTAGECWLWTASVNRKGYGQIRINRILTYVHRFSYELHIGPIPEGLVIDHECRVHRCVNPRHLRAVTSKENTNAFGSLSGIKQRLRTCCPKDHEYTPENTYIAPRGDRQCRICMRVASTKWKRSR